MYEMERLCVGKVKMALIVY